MSTLKDGDLFITEREGTNYKVRSDQMSTLNDTDLFVVEREGVNYKIEAQDLNIAPPEAPLITGVITDLDVSADRFTNEQFKIDISVQESAGRTDQEVKPYVVSTYVPPLPDGEYHGLRFDSSRETTLLRPGIEDNSRRATFSCWVKRTTDTGNKHIFSIGNDTPDDAQYTAFRQDEYGNITLRGFQPGGGQFFELTSSERIAMNTWTNVMFTVDSDAGEAGIYINGVLDNTGTLSTTGEYSWELCKYLGIGCLTNTGDATQTTFDGYISEAYYVEDLVSPTTFGGEVDGVWLPKTPDEVAGRFGDSPVINGDACNGSQVWSDYGNTDNMQKPWLESFNGISNSFSIPDVGSDSLVDFTGLNGGIPYNTLRVYVARDNAAPDLFVNNTALNVPQTGSAGYTYYWMDIAGPGVLENLGHYTRNTGPNGGSGFAYIEVDGEILVDNVTYGPNGFYLPFNPEATGENYSHTASISDPNAGPITKLFNGVIGGSGSSYAVDLKAGTITFNPPLTYTESFGVYASASNFSIDIGNGYVQIGDGNPLSDGTLYPIATGSGSITTIRGSTSSGAGWLYALNVDGNILIDHTSISVDASGNENTFHDENFLISPNNLVYSNSYVGTFSQGVATDAFTGNFESQLPYINTSNDITFTPVGGIAGITSFTANGGVYTGGSSNWNFDIIYLDDTTDTITVPINNLAYNTDVDLVAAGYNTSKPGLKSMTVNATTNGQAGNWGINNFVINGQLLVDANIQDTVTDTPVRDYAVLIGGLNGNLQTNGDNPDSRGTINIPNSTTTYYCEVYVSGSAETAVGLSTDTYSALWYQNGSTSADMVNVSPGATAYTNGDVIGIVSDGAAITFYRNGVKAFDATININRAYPSSFAVFGPSGDTSKINFGQQPFAASNVTYDQETGVVVIDDPSWNSSQEWSSLGDGPSNGSQELPNNNPPTGYKMMFDGSLDTFMCPKGDGQTAEAEFIGMPTGYYTVNLNVTSPSVVTINGTAITDVDGWVEIGQDYFTSIVCTQNGGQYAAIRAVALENKTLVDTSQTIYQTLFNAPIDSTSLTTLTADGPGGSYASGRLYLVLDSSGNVTDLQEADPGYTILADAKEYTITWPALLPSGEAPDVELPAGSQICSYVKATNDVGSIEKLTNHLTPT